jgi:hypothetical protein
MHIGVEAIAALMLLVVCSCAALSFRAYVTRRKTRESERAWKNVEKYIG